MTDVTLPPVGDDRPMWPAMKRGFMCRCPACGEGELLSGYLSVNTTCSACGTEFFHHRADDGPAYLTIVAVGKILGPLVFVAFKAWNPEPWVLALCFSLAAIALSLFLLPRLKGMLIAIQWSRRMHGFGRVKHQ